MRVAVLLFGLSLVACESPFQESCEAACRPAKEAPCASEDPTSCVDECVVATTGLTDLCGRCVVEHTGFDRADRPASDPEGTLCHGYKVGGVTSSECIPLCLEEEP